MPQRLDALLERVARARQAWLKAKAASDERRRLLAGTKEMWRQNLNKWLRRKRDR